MNALERRDFLKGTATDVSPLLTVLRQCADPASLHHVSLGRPRRTDDFGVGRSLDGEMVQITA